MMENDAEDSRSFSLHDLLSLFLRKRQYFILPFIVILLSVLAYAYTAQAIYRSSAKVLIDQPSLQNDKVTTLAGATEHRIQIISEKILTRENLKEVLLTYDLYPESYIASPELAIKSFRESISLKPINTELVDPRTGRMRESTIAFLVAFEYTDPETAKKVADHLVSLFLEKNEVTRKDRAEKSSNFLIEQAEKLAVQVEEQERKLAEFKRANAGNLPELHDANMQAIERSERQLLTATEELRSLNEQAIFVEAELSQTSKTGMLVGSSGERILTNEEKVKTLMTELADAKRRYSSSHPDVKRLERQLVEARKGKGGEDAAFYSQSAPDNPAYIQLQSKLRSLRVEIQSVKRREISLQNKLSAYEKRLNQSPLVEKEYLVLTRDYENVLAKYRETKQQVLQSQLAVAAEESSQGNTFSLLETPRVDFTPVRPNRSAIAIIGLLLASIVGVAAVFIADHMDTTVRNVHDLIALGGRAPIGVIGKIESSADIWKRRMLIASIVVGVSLVGALGYIFSSSDAEVQSALIERVLNN